MSPYTDRSFGRSSLQHPLVNGYIHNWLVAGPAVTPVENLAGLSDLDCGGAPDNGLRDRIGQSFQEDNSAISERPLQQAKFTTCSGELTWEYRTCLDDHLLDFSGYYPTGGYLQSWAYAEIESQALQECTLTLSSYGPFSLWLDDEQLYRQDKHFGSQPGASTVSLTLMPGLNRLLVRFEILALRATPYAFAVRVGAFEGGPAPVHIPIAVDAGDRYRLFEEFFQHLYLDRDVYAYQDKIVLRWPPGLEAPANYTARLQRRPRRIYAEAEGKIKDSGDRTFLQAGALPDDLYEVVMMPGPDEFYHQQIRIQRALPLVSLRTQYSQIPYGTYPERQEEALRFAAGAEGLFAEIAKMAGGWWKDVRLPVIEAAIARVDRREDGSNLLLLGLLGMLARFGENAEFAQSLLQPLQNCITGYRYACDEPGSDVMDFHASQQQILFHACQLLAGERFPQHRFGNSGFTGSQQRERGMRGTLTWLESCASFGFDAWDTPATFVLNLIALSHLVDLAQDEEVWELASVVMDKIFLALALNNYAGVCGSSQRDADASSIKSGQLSPTAGISRLMWGIGTWNPEIAGPVSLACCQSYEMPPLIAAIASELPRTPIGSCERHAGRPPGKDHQTESKWEVHKAAYKTAHYLLAAAQDYRPGEPGHREHIWQATLGADAIVFTNHPTCMSESDALAPGFWRGNGRLPRVAQWKDLLVAIYQLPEDDGLGFTHAYFPTFAFDEHQVSDDWTFARKGNGYLALKSSLPLELITQGRNAFRELRALGHQAIWLCQMGTQEDYGSFSGFRDQMLTARVHFAGLSVAYQRRPGEQITFGWDRPLAINGQEQTLRYERHYDGPHCVAQWPATEMFAAYGEDAIRIAFSASA